MKHDRRAIPAVVLFAKKRLRYLKATSAEDSLSQMSKTV